MAVEFSKQASHDEEMSNALVVNTPTEMTMVENHHGGLNTAIDNMTMTMPHQTVQSHQMTTMHHAHHQTYQPSTSTHFNHLSHTGAGRVISTVQGEARETGQTHIIATRTGDKRFTGETRVVETIQQGTMQVGTRVVGVEKGVERQISVTEVAVGEEVIGERTAFVGKGRRGKKVVREVVEEKTIVVPVVSQIEEWVEDEYDMEETVVEVAKKYQIEKIVEVPEIEIVEKVIEQIEKVVREKVVEVPKIQTVEKIVEIPVIQTVEKIVEVPEVQYNDVPVEKIVEVPEIKTEEVIREVKKANFVDKPIEKKMLIADAKTHSRKLPVPVEAETVVEFTVPHLRANYVKKKFPVYLPRFVEVPVSRQFVNAETIAMTDKYAARLSNLISVKPAVSLCEIEGLASEMKAFYDEHQIHDKKTQIGGVVDEATKRTMFSRNHHDLGQYALYKNLPVEVSDVVVGRHHALTNEGHAITYNSATFGNSSASFGHSASFTHTTTHALPTTYTTHQPSTAYKVGHAIGSALNHH